MSDPMTAILLTLNWEGGLVQNPSDRGGLSNFGISQASYPNLDIRNLTKTQAIAIYRQTYWLPLYDQIADQAVANKLFDLGVNMGVKTAVLLLQHALGCLEAGPLVCDGTFGEQTLAAVNASPNGKLLLELKARAFERYCQICAENPSQVEFALGWGRRLVG
jgi:lysozyme family protein